MKIKFTLTAIASLLIFNIANAEQADETKQAKIADNGVTVLCDHLAIGERFEYNGNMYLVVNNETARDKTNLQQLTEGDIRYCTSHVTNMAYMLHGLSTADEFRELIDNTEFEDLFLSFNQAVNDWDVSNVTTMEGLFIYQSLFDQPVNHWDVSNVTDMNGMFLFAKSFNQLLNHWNVSNVKNMEAMFYKARAFNSPIGSWDVSNVTNMRGMFCGADEFNRRLTHWDVSNVTDMAYMFADNRVFNQPIGNWDVSSVTNMEVMFLNANSFEQYIGDWDVSNVINMENIFGTSSYRYDISNWAVQPD